MKIKVKEFKKLIRECIKETLIENLSSDDKDALYVEYIKPMSNEVPFELRGEKFEYCWCKYPSGKIDIGVYAYRGDLCYGYEAFKKRYNLTNLLENKLNESKPVSYKTDNLTSNRITIPKSAEDIKYRKRWSINSVQKSHNPKKGGGYKRDKSWKKDLEESSVNMVYPENFKNVSNYIRIIRKPETDKFVVAWYQQGKVNDFRSYYTDNEKNAIDTFEAMKKDVDALNRGYELNKAKPRSTDTVSPSLKEMTTTGSVQGFLSKNWCDPDPKRSKMKNIAKKSVGGNLA